MCGRMNVSDDPLTAALTEALGVSNRDVIKSNDIAPGGKLSIVRDTPNGRHANAATWWLFLDDKTLKPNYKYASFNSRSDKLNVSRSIAYKPYREGRCIIPASGFVEGLGDKKTYFHLKAKDAAIAFGGLYKEWLNKDTGEIVYSASIITLPSHEKLKDIHPKSIPLMLPWQDGALVSQWLDCNFHQIEAFNELLVPKIREDVFVTPIDRPSTRNPVAESFVIDKDAA